MVKQLKRAALVLFAATALCNTGCFVNQYAADPATRMDQMINQSEDMRQIGLTWRRFWFNDMPSHMTPERLNGGVF